MSANNRRQTTAICQQTRRRRNSLDENNSHLLLFMTIKIARTVIVFYKSWRRCQLCLCSASSAVRKVLRLCHCSGGGWCAAIKCTCLLQLLPGLDLAPDLQSSGAFFCPDLLEGEDPGISM